MKYKLVVFDFDGVLADSESCEEVNLLRESHFPELPAVADQEDMARLYCGPLRTSLRRFGLADEQGRMFFDLHSRAMERRIASIRLYAEAVDIFFDIPEQRRAIVTSAYSAAVRTALERCQPAHICQRTTILGREFRQPKSEKFATLSAKCGVARKEILTIGDTVSDILYAQEFGVAVCAVGWGYHPLRYLAAFNPTCMAEHPEDLRKILGLAEAGPRFLTERAKGVAA